MRFEVETDDRWLDWGESWQDTVALNGSVVVYVKTPQGGLVGEISLSPTEAREFAAALTAAAEEYRS